MKHYPVCLFLLGCALQAGGNGADTRLTGTACHGGTTLNGGGGSVTIQLPGDATYTPDVNR
jgi:hypothetical protein